MDQRVKRILYFIMMTILLTLVLVGTIELFLWLVLVAVPAITQWIMSDLWHVFVILGVIALIPILSVAWRESGDLTDESSSN